MNLYTKLFDVEAWITQFFGYTEFAKNNPNYAVDSDGNPYHEGIDIVPIDRKSLSLYTPCTGIVEWAGWGDTYGNNVIIHSHKIGLSLRYCHLDSYYVNMGSEIHKGQKIGIIGNSGSSTAIHLHLNVVPMKTYGVKDFPGNGFKGRVDPLGVLLAFGVNI